MLNLQEVLLLGKKEGAEGEGDPETSLMYNAPRPPKVTDLGDGISREIDASTKRTTLITDEVRVFKGGSWKDRAYWLDPAQRRFMPQYMATDYIGFRCAMSRVGSKSQVKKTPRHKRRG